MSDQTGSLPPRLSFFDLDGTLLRGTSSFWFFFYLIATRRLPFTSLFRALPLLFSFRKGNLSLVDLHTKVFKLFLQGRPRRLFTDAVEPFLDRFWERMVDPKILFYLRAESHPILISSAPDFLLGPIAQKLGIAVWYGSQYAVDKDEIFCNISSRIDGKEKLRLARLLAEERSIPQDQTAAFSDSDDDLPLLEWVATAYAVKPSPTLKRVALKKGWSILS